MQPLEDRLAASHDAAVLANKSPRAERTHKQLQYVVEDGSGRQSLQ